MESIEAQQFDWHAVAAAKNQSVLAIQHTLGLEDWRTSLHIEPPDWLLPGLLQRGSLHILTSDSGCCKTWLGLSMALSGLYGVPTLGCEPARPFSSVYLAADSPRWDINQQLKKLLLADSLDPAKAKEQFFILPIGTLLDNIDHCKLLCEFIKVWDIDALFIDVLLYAHTGDENDNGYMARTVLKNAKVLRDDTGCAIYFIHHNAKPKPDGSVSFRGAGTLVQAVEHHLALTRSGTTIFAEVKKLRGDEDTHAANFQYILQRLPNGGRRLCPRADTHRPELRLSASDVLGRGPATRDTLVASLCRDPSVTPKMVDNQLQYLRRTGAIKLSPQGEWTLVSDNQ